MENIKESIKILASVASHRAVMDKFARTKFHEKFDGKSTQTGTYHYYSGYDIVSENKIRIEFKYGAGDMDFNDYFYVEI